MAYVGHDDPQYLYAEWIAAFLEARQAHKEYCEIRGLDNIESARRYWWAAQSNMLDYRGKLRYGLDGKPRDLSALCAWRGLVPQAD